MKQLPIMRAIQRWLRAVGILLGLSLLTGCLGVNPTMDMITTLLPGKEPALLVAKGYEYLLIEIDGRKTAMALGYRQEVDAGT